MCRRWSGLSRPIPAGALLPLGFAACVVLAAPVGSAAEPATTAPPAGSVSGAAADSASDGGGQRGDLAQGAQGGDASAKLEDADYGYLYDTVRKLRTERGRYGRGLDAALLDLGEALMEAGEHLLAANAFKEALFVARANHGLYSQRQLAALKKLAAANKAAGRTQAVIDNYFLMYWIHKRQYGELDPRLLPIIDEVSRAQSALYLGDDQPMDRDAFMERRRILGDAVDIVEANYGPRDPRIAGVLNRVAWANFALARQTGKLMHYRAYNASKRGGTVFVDEAVAQSFTMIDEAVRRGGKALDRIEDLFEEQYESDPAAAAYPLAIARIHLGDWELLYGSGTARSEYREAYELLGESADGAAADRLLGRPKLLPAPIDFPGLEVRKEDEERPPDDPSRVVTLSMEIAFTGRVRDVEILEAADDLRENAENLAQFMKFQRFRPRVEDGGTVTSSISRRYFVKEDGSVILLDRFHDRAESAQTAADSSPRTAPETVSGEDG